jgi:hypothetical protein
MARTRQYFYVATDAASHFPFTLQRQLDQANPKCDRRRAVGRWTRSGVGRYYDGPKRGRRYRAPARAYSSAMESKVAPSFLRELRDGRGLRLFDGRFEFRGRHVSDADGLLALCSEIPGALCHLCLRSPASASR